MSRESQEWTRDIQRRVRRLERPGPTLRVGSTPWVFSMTADGNLVLSRPGVVKDAGSDPVESTVLDLTRGFVSGNDVAAAVNGIPSAASAELNKAADYLRDRWDDGRAMIDGFLANFKGVGLPIDGSVWRGSDASDSVAEHAASVAALTTQLSKLQSQVDAISGATSVVVDFSQRSNASSLGSDFDQVYTGGGGGHFGISSGRAAGQNTFGAARGCNAFYNLATTSTDNQLIGATYPNGNETWAFDHNADCRVLLLGRANATYDTFVFVELWANRLVFGCYVAGVRTVFFTDTQFRFNANSSYWLKPGVGANPLDFRVMQGASPLTLHTGTGDVTTFTDASAVSKFGSDGLGGYYRGGGLGIWMMANPAFYIRPASAAVWAFADA